MNLSDVAGIVFIVIGLLCVLPTVYLSPIFLLVSGGFIAAGIVLIITAGNMCRAAEDVTPGKDKLYATIQLPEEPKDSVVVTKATRAPSLSMIPAA